MATATDDPWASYARTIVTIERPQGPVEICAAPGGVVGEWPWPFSEPLHVLTAWDPGDARPGDAVNRDRQHRLEADVRLRTDAVWAAVGVDPVTGHREEGVVVAGLSGSEARAFGARYGQEAIFVWTPSEWAIVACASERRVVSGWVVRIP